MSGSAPAVCRRRGRRERPAPRGGTGRSRTSARPPRRRRAPRSRRGRPPRSRQRRRSGLSRRLTVAGPRMQISVIGSGSEHEERAEAVGRLLAERGCTVVCGGLGEVMAAAARGAKAAGGTTIGILPGERHEDANEWIDHVGVTGIAHARKLAVVASAHAGIALGWPWGPLAEIGYARTPGRAVANLGSCG